MKIHNNNKIIKGLTVEVKYDNIDRALRKLKKSIDEDGRLDLVKERKHFTKPSVEKRLAKKAAVLRQKRKSDENKLK